MVRKRTKPNLNMNAKDCQKTKTEILISHNHIKAHLHTATNQARCFNQALGAEKRRQASEEMEASRCMKGSSSLNE